ncbi:MAG: lipoate--protein ligase family protein [Anaerolineales bacterium]|nr:lipoate--protein ligase family protein [Anaerolineales bacterium]
MSSAPNTWRLVRTPPLAGALNMAIDEAILNAIAAGAAPPTLRFFAWDPPTLSLGYGQPIADVDPARLATRGWGLVRRPTGGRAILHTDELTYSVAAPMDEPRVVGSVVESYRRLSAGLLAGLQRLGLQARADRKDPTQTVRGPDGAPVMNPVCFEVPSDYEITADGRKLLGSAQVRKRGVVLQHGTLPLDGDITRILDGLAYPDAERETLRGRVRSRAATLADIGLSATWSEAAEALTQGFAEALGLTFVEGELSPAERADAERQVVEKYGDPGWTGRV